MAMQAKRIVEGKHQIVVRIPVSLHSALTDLATRNGLSVNAQVCELVKEATDLPDPTPLRKTA